MGLRLSKIIEQFYKKGHRSYLQPELRQVSLAVWWCISEAAPHLFQLQGGIVSISKCQISKIYQQEAFQSWHGGLWPYPWEQPLTSQTPQPHLTRGESLPRDVVPGCSALVHAESYLSSQIIPVGFLYSKMHKYRGCAQRMNLLLPSLVW